MDPLARPRPIALESIVVINLASAGLLDLLRALPEPLLVPPEVVEETAGAGERLGYVDAVAIRKALAAGTLRPTRETPTPGPCADCRGSRDSVERMRSWWPSP